MSSVLLEIVLISVSFVLSRQLEAAFNKCQKRLVCANSAQINTSMKRGQVICGRADIYTCMYHKAGILSEQINNMRSFPALSVIMCVVLHFFVMIN